MEVSESDLTERYSEMETEELVRLQLAGGLTDQASKTLKKVLDGRGVNSIEKEEIETEVKLEIENALELASLGARFVAQILDGILASFLIFIPVLVFGSSSDLGVGLGFFCFIVYLLFQDALPNGQSIGKRVMKIAVVNKTTRKPCKHTESIVRNSLLLFIGFIDLLTIGSKYKQRMGDMLANTIVIKSGGTVN